MAITRTTEKIRVSQPRRFTTGEYARLIETGILAEDERVELIEGEIITMAPIGSRHAATVNRLNRLLGYLSASNRVFVSVQNPVHLDDYSEPQPDLVVARVRPDDYAGGHPTPPDILLLVEVMDNTQESDRKEKLPLYAHAGIAEIWLIDIVRGLIEAYQEPSREGYRSVRIYAGDETLSPTALPDFAVRVSDLLPKK